MEKIFDIAKDSEQKWGVIAQGIDGNFEHVTNKIETLLNGKSDPSYESKSLINKFNTLVSGITLVKGREYKMCVKLPQASTSTCYLYLSRQEGSDSDIVAIGHPIIAIGDTEIQYSFIAPSDESNLYFLFYSLRVPSCLFDFFEIEEGILNKMHDIETDISFFQENEGFFGKDYSSEAIQGYFLNTNVGIGGDATDVRANSSYTYIKLKVRKGEVYYITARRGSSASAAFSLADNSLKFVYISEKSYTDEPVIISQDGWMICNSLDEIVVYTKDYSKEVIKSFEYNDEKPFDKGIIYGGAVSVFPNICVIGDSLSAGCMVFGDATDSSDDKSGQTDMYNYSWGKFLAKNCHCNPYIIAQGGLAARTFFDDDRRPSLDNMNIEDALKEDGTPMPFHEQLTSGKYNSEAYFIALGHNDYNMWKSDTWNPNKDNWSVYLGSPDDINLVDGVFVKSFYGYYAKIIYTIKQQVPNAKIFAITMKQEGVKHDGGVMGVGGFKDLNNAIRYMATIFDNIYILDMAKERPEIPDWHYTNGHGNALGYGEYGAEIGTYVDWMIKKNPTLFGYVQFINTSYANRIPSDAEISIGSSQVE